MKSNLRTLLGLLEYFAAPPANTCAQQPLQTLWGRQGLWGKVWLVETWLWGGLDLWGGVVCGEGVAFGGRGLCGKAWLSGPESPGTNPGSCFTFLIWTDVLLNRVLL